MASSMTSIQVPADSGLEDEIEDDMNSSMDYASLDMEKMLNLINGERQSRGIAPLCFNRRLNIAALAHTNDMVNNGFFSDIGSDESTFEDRIFRAGYGKQNDSITHGENISQFDSTIELAHKGIMNHAVQRSTILDSRLKHIGLGIVKTSNRGYVITQTFAYTISEICSGGSGGLSDKFYLINRQSGKALHVDHGNCNDGTNIITWERGNLNPYQVFHYHYPSKAIVSVKCGKPLDIKKGIITSCLSLSEIILQGRDGSESQKFEIKDGKIVSLGCEGKSIETFGTFNGAKAVINFDNDVFDKQKWNVVYL